MLARVLDEKLINLGSYLFQLSGRNLHVLHSGPAGQKKDGYKKPPIRKKMLYAPQGRFLLGTFVHAVSKALLPTTKSISVTIDQI